MRRWGTAALLALAVAVTLAGVSLAVFTDRKTNPQTLQAATSWPTPTPTTTPTPTPGPGSGLRAQYRNNTPSQPTDNAITPWLRVINTSSKAVDLAPVKARYWFTKDAPAEKVVNSFCDYAWLDCTPSGKVTHRIVAMPAPVTGADTYVEVGFKSGRLEPKGSVDANNMATDTTFDIQLRIHKDDYSNFDERDDYSWAASDQLQEWSKVALYYNGALVWGTAP